MAALFEVRAVRTLDTGLGAWQVVEISSGRTIGDPLVCHDEAQARALRFNAAATEPLRPRYTVRPQRQLGTSAIGLWLVYDRLTETVVEQHFPFRNPADQAALLLERQHGGQ
jgi:hypothetical protein